MGSCSKVIYLGINFWTTCPKVKNTDNRDIHNLHYEKFQDGTIKCIEDEIPFDVPEGWAWTRLGNICPYGDCEKTDPKYIDADAWILDLEDIEKETGMILAHITNKERGSISTKHKFKEGQLLYSKLRPYLNKVVIADNDGYCTSEILPLFFFGNIYPKYMQLFLMSDTFLSYVNMISYGVKMPRLGTSDGRAALISMPPLSQQKEIVDIVKKAITEIFNIAIEQNRLQLTIEQTKTKILDLAIRGKLVPQDPTDEPASVLLERIRAEKEELIEQGKIKRDKNDSVIYKGDDNSYYEKIGNKVVCINEEIPFELPDNWMFIRLKSIWQLLSGRDLAPSEYNSNSEGIPYITGASNFSNGSVAISRWTTTPQVISETGDLLFTCKGTVGEIAFNDFGNAHIARQIMAIRNIFNLDSEYMELCIRYYLDLLITSAKGLIPGISREDILNLILPIPPQQYQNRLVLRMKEIDKAIASAQGYIS